MTTREEKEEEEEEEVMGDEIWKARERGLNVRANSWRFPLRWRGMMDERRRKLEREEMRGGEIRLETKVWWVGN